MTDGMAQLLATTRSLREQWGTVEGRVWDTMRKCFSSDKIVRRCRRQLDRNFVTDELEGVKSYRFLLYGYNSTRALIGC